MEITIKRLIITNKP